MTRMRSGRGSYEAGAQILQATAVHPSNDDGLQRNKECVGVMCDQVARHTHAYWFTLHKSQTPDAVCKHSLTVLSRTLLQLTNMPFFLLETS
jgi:hypothetical protein